MANLLLRWSVRHIYVEIGLVQFSYFLMIKKYKWLETVPRFFGYYAFICPPPLPFLLSRSQTFLNVLKESWAIVLQAYWHRHWLFFFSLNLTIFRGIIISTIIIIILLSLLATLTYEALRQNWSESQAVTKSWFVSISLLNLQKKTQKQIVFFTPIMWFPNWWMSCHSSKTLEK